MVTFIAALQKGRDLIAVPSVVCHDEHDRLLFHLGEFVEGLLPFEIAEVEVVGILLGELCRRVFRQLRPRAVADVTPEKSKRRSAKSRNRRPPVPHPAFLPLAKSSTAGAGSGSAGMASAGASIAKAVSPRNTNQARTLKTVSSWIAYGGDRGFDR